MRYHFSSYGSLDQYETAISESMASLVDLAWDFGDGTTRGFEWSDRTLSHEYKKPGTYVAKLTVRSQATGKTDTAQMTITLGPAWLAIESMTWEDPHRPDGQLYLTVVVRNQSRQTLPKIAVDLWLDGSLMRVNALSATLEGDSPSTQPLAPGGTYTLHTFLYPWTGELTASSGWCVPYPLGQ